MDRLNFIIYIVLFATLIVKMKCDFTDKCQTGCECRWEYQLKSASCINQGLSKIPSNLSDEIQALNLSSNPIIEIEQNAFLNVNLVNLKKIYMNNCSIETIHKNNFKDLKLLLELDLANNNIKVLDENTFNDIEMISKIILNSNNIKKIYNHTFNNLKNLQHIDLSNNKIDAISSDAFKDLPALKVLLLHSNRLTQIIKDTLDLKSLTTLSLTDNLWKCDCYLKPFRDMVIDTYKDRQVSCNEPENMKNKSWIVIDSDDFACKPKIIDPQNGFNITADSDKKTISCTASGDPPPDFIWFKNISSTNTQIINGEKYNITNNVNSSDMIINNITNEDAIEYTCVAYNAAGSDSRTITLIVNRSITPIASSLMCAGKSMFIIIVASVTFILVLFLCICVCKKRRDETPTISDLSLHHKKLEREISSNLTSTINHSSNRDTRSSSLIEENIYTEDPTFKSTPYRESIVNLKEPLDKQLKQFECSQTTDSAFDDFDRHTLNTSRLNESTTSPGFKSNDISNSQLPFVSTYDTSQHENNYMMLCEMESFKQ